MKSNKEPEQMQKKREEVATIQHMLHILLHVLLDICNETWNIMMIRKKKQIMIQPKEVLVFPESGMG